MPYYCTVPRCTSMAGKAKNVSFHQFPRDVELAKLWNDILKRGKPYTKYSKVCSLHFKPEDYTITSAGKNKDPVIGDTIERMMSGSRYRTGFESLGHVRAEITIFKCLWRTLRKDAIPSQKLPSDTPAPYTRRQSGAWVPNNVPALDPQLHQQAQQHLAQAFYMQTMLAMQAVGVPDPLNSICNGLSQPPTEESSPPTPEDSQTEPHSNRSSPITTQRTNHDNPENRTSFQCEECSKCFKDPDVFILHKRSHQSTEVNGKENFDLNTLKPEMLKSNPILANLLMNTMERNIFTRELEKQMLVSFSNVENFLRSVSKFDDCDNSELGESLDDSLVIDENVA